MQHTNVLKISAIVAGVIVLTMVVIGLFLVGSPAQERTRRRDQERVSELSMLQNHISTYWQVKRTLPATLAEVNDETRGIRVPTDPDPTKMYTYEKVGELSFRLCADFELASMDDEVYFEESWKHTAGRNCFQRTIDPDFYPPFDTTRPIGPKPIPAPIY